MEHDNQCSSHCSMLNPFSPHNVKLRRHHLTNKHTEFLHSHIPLSAHCERGIIFVVGAKKIKKHFQKKHAAFHNLTIQKPKSHEILLSLHQTLSLFMVKLNHKKGLAD